MFGNTPPPPPPLLSKSPASDPGASPATKGSPSVSQNSSVRTQTPFTTPLHSPTMGSFRSETTPKQANRGALKGEKLQFKGKPAIKPFIRQKALPKPRPASKCPLYCCFYAEFDNKVGSKLCFQSPKGFMEHNIDISPEEVQTLLQDEFVEILSADPPSMSNLQTSSEDAEDSTVDNDDHHGRTHHRPTKICISTTAADMTDDDDIETTTPDNSIFESCSDYIITGSALEGNIINLSTHHYHVLTRPTSIANERYERNSYQFCVGFILRRDEDPRPFRPVLSKWALTLRAMEVESLFLTSSHTRPQIQGFLEHILVSLNSPQWECNLMLSPANCLNLKLFHPPKAPAAPVPDHAVPVLLRREWQVQMYDWDLAINWVSLHIDGVTNAKRISQRAEVDMEMVRACLRVLKHHGVIDLVDMFFYSNRYECTSKAASVLAGQDGKLLQEAADFCVRRMAKSSSGSNIDASPASTAISPLTEGSRQPYATSSTPPLSNSLVNDGSQRQRANSAEVLVSPPPFRSRDELMQIKRGIAEFFCCCNRSTSFGELWISLLTDEDNSVSQFSTDFWRKMFNMTDHRRLASFGVVHKLIRRVHCYPMLVYDEPKTLGYEQIFGPMWVEDCVTGSRTGSSFPGVNREEYRTLRKKIEPLMDGRHCDDEIGCVGERSFDDLMELLFPNERVMKVYA